LIDVVYSGAVGFLRPLLLPFHLLSPRRYQTATIFAYGVTSSGKTHTMQGTRAQPGVIPRAVRVGS
jgi:hypothetical protein